MFELDAMAFSHFLLAMALLLALAHLLGYIAERFMIPRVIGEVASGLVIGPTILGYFFPDAFHWLFTGSPIENGLFGFMYQIGLIMLMFCSGLKFHSKLKSSDGKIMLAIVVSSTVLPFIIGWFATSLFDVNQYFGPAGSLFAMKIVVAISIAVTSIPVISKIFNDLGIMHSRFAKVIVGIAGIHDVLLWVALGVATSVASQTGVVSFGTVSKSLWITGVFIFGTIFLLRILFKYMTMQKANLLFRSSPVGYFLFVVFIFSVLAGYLGVDIMFGALLVGISAKLALSENLFKHLEQSVSNISFSWFIPVYFAIVGLKLDLAQHFNVLFFLKYLLLATLAQIIIVFLTCKLLKLDHLTSLNFSMAMNARGGPGIVLSTVAYGAGIINQEFFSILVMLALVTSWFAGTWIRIVLSKGWVLMPGDENLVPEQKNNNDFL